MNHRTTAAALASCALAVAALTACGSGDTAASHKELATGAGTSAVGTATPPAGSETSQTPAGALSPSASASASANQVGGGTASPSATRQAAKKGKAALPPRPDRDGEGAYVRALTAIDPDIVHDKEDEAVERGRDQCATIHAHPGDREKQISAAMQRFVSPGHPDGFGRVKSTRIVEAVHTNLCPDY
ncbi:hypothetical protein [Streptomyces griseoruber]|uniref:DUF732 domain-containing protein n=1 Tax=Streptomyces griseoruber TaxID=1943 RepID=A0A101SVZ3_9ACTN|nr:hypothetical protein [Streptomyces griseoruber]KUN81081.1 hypothetical protein AQJ64_23985 [Streptomyces griseoruber]